MHNNELEGRLVREDAAAHNLKGKAYQIRMDRINESIKTAESADKEKRFKGIRDQTIEKYNKYRGTNHKN